MEDFNKVKMLAKRLVKTHFKEQWQWRVDVIPPQWAIDAGIVQSSLLSRLNKEDAAGDLVFSVFDLYARDISYGPTEIETEQFKVGGVTLTYPTGAAPVGITMTMRDHADERVARFYDSLCGLVVNDDGTVNLPYGNQGYLTTFVLYAMDGDKQRAAHVWKVLPTRRGDVQAAVDGEGFMEFPIAFMQFRSIGD